MLNIGQMRAHPQQSGADQGKLHLVVSQIGNDWFMALAGLILCTNLPIAFRIPIRIQLVGGLLASRDAQLHHVPAMANTHDCFVVQILR